MAQVEFRDGSREVPDHLADLMITLDTYKMTFEEAKAKAEKKLTVDLLNRAQQNLIASHFKRVP